MTEHIFNQSFTISLSLSHTHTMVVIGVEEQYNVFIQLNLELWYSIKYTIY